VTSRKQTAYILTTCNTFTFGCVQSQAQLLLLILHLYITSLWAKQHNSNQRILRNETAGNQIILNMNAFLSLFISSFHLSFCPSILLFFLSVFLVSLFPSSFISSLLLSFSFSPVCYSSFTSIMFQFIINSETVIVLQQICDIPLWMGKKNSLSTQ
jgi:hypothetical protein